MIQKKIKFFFLNHNNGLSFKLTAERKNTFFPSSAGRVPVFKIFFFFLTIVNNLDSVSFIFIYFFTGLFCFYVIFF